MSYTLQLDYYKNDLTFTQKSNGTLSTVSVKFFSDEEGVLIPVGVRMKDKKYSEKWETNSIGITTEHIDSETQEVTYYAEIACSSVNKGEFSLEVGDLDELITEVEGITSIVNSSVSTPGKYPVIGFDYISGGEEVCQRVKIALQHQFSEYFLNRLGGIPYYINNEEQVKVLGSKNSDQIICNLFRKKLMAVPGVLQVMNPSITRIGRESFFSCSILVDKNNESSSNSEYQISNIQIGA